MKPQTSQEILETIRAILRDVSAATGVPVARIVSSDVGSHLVADARHLFMLVAYVTTSLSPKEIGEIAARDQTSVHHALRKMHRLLPRNQQLAETYAGLLKGRTVLRSIAPGRRHDKTRTVESNVPSTATHGYISQLCPEALTAKLKEAMENVAYWRAARVRALNPEVKVRAGALLAAWEMQVHALEQQLQLITH